jgi:hypothetical protein
MYLSPPFFVSIFPFDKNLAIFFAASCFSATHSTLVTIIFSQDANFEDVVKNDRTKRYIKYKCS